MRFSLIVLLALGAAALAGCRTTPRAATQPPGGTGSAAAVASPTPLATTDTRCCVPCEIGCWPEPRCDSIYLDASASFLPNVGVGLGAGKVFWRQSNNTWAFEVAGTYQFIDDKTFADDGTPEAGDWTQIRVGIKNSFSPKARRHLTTRFGAVWLNVEGEPNIIDDPGNYWGIYGGIGFETDLTSSLTVGPEVAILVVSEEDQFHVVRPIPQINWHVTWWPGRGGNGCLSRAPIGELYLGASALAVPGLGGGVEAGQVFSRSSVATWSLELLTGFEAPSDSLGFKEDGKWAQIRGGVKASFQPCCRGHWTARAGAAWLRSTAANDLLDETGDHVGIYLGAGYEWDIGNRFTTGPEISLMLVSKEQEFEVQAVPQLNWHFILKL